MRCTQNARRHFTPALAGYTELDPLEAEHLRTALAGLAAADEDG
ncbi:hypothetical protein ACQEVC_20340 [Plantactinospora sp. CA-294935]